MDAEERYIPIKRMSYEILKEYRKLTRLEEKGLSYTVDYDKTLSRIKTLTKLEEALYFDISSESSDFISEIAYEALFDIDNNNPVTFFHNDASVLFNELSDDELVASRVIRKLIVLYNRADSSRTEYNLSNITEYLMELKYAFYFNILDDELSDSNYIKSKYDMAYVFSYRSKNKPLKCDINNKVLSDDLAYITECFYKISLLDAQSINLPSNQKKLFFSTAYLRAALLRLDISYAYTVYEKMIENMKENGIEPSEGINIIEDLILNLEEDKKKYIHDYVLKRKY